MIASMLNIAGPDMMILLLLLFVLAPLSVGLVLLVIYLVRRTAASRPPEPPTESLTTERLHQLEHLRRQKLVSEAEYEEQKRRIMTGD